MDIKRMKWLTMFVVLTMMLVFAACGNVDNQVQKKIDDVSNDVNTETIPPSTPELSSATATATGITLKWSAAKDTVKTSLGTFNDIPVSGYKIYRNGVQIQSNISELAFTDSVGLTHATQYCYTVTSFDHANNESAKSQELCAITP